MVYVRKPIDIVSPSDGKRYTSISEYEKSLDRKGHYIMEDKTYKQLKERLLDEQKTPSKPEPAYNHIHIDFANGRVEKSVKDINDR